MSSKELSDTLKAVMDVYPTITDEQKIAASAIATQMEKIILSSAKNHSTQK
jgi:hypothetical protein